MKKQIILIALLGAFSSAFSADTAVPAGVTLPPVPSATGAAPANRARVDDVLGNIQQNLFKGDSADEQSKEQSLNRNIGMQKNGGQVIKPIGFVHAGATKYALAKNEVGEVVRLREGRSYGKVKVIKIEDDGVDYTIGSDRFFAPIAFVPTEMSKAKAANHDASGPAGMPK